MKPFNTQLPENQIILNVHNKTECSEFLHAANVLCDSIGKFSIENSTCKRLQQSSTYN